MTEFLCFTSKSMNWSWILFGIEMSPGSASERFGLYHITGSVGTLSCLVFQPKFCGRGKVRLTPASFACSA
jgi:hypothetical protein